MSNTEIRLTRINKQLANIPPQKLNEVENVISFLLAQKKTKPKRVIKLTGIWEGQGFEKINLKKELKSIRNNLSRTILKQAV
jgi:hypothetical protein